MQLFDDAPFAQAPPARPRREPDATAWCGGLSHPQFEYDRARAVFGSRPGHGPLLIAPDTNLLIDLVDAFDQVESHFGLAGPLPRGDHDDPVAALRDLFALWFFRDVRWVVDDEYLLDARKPLSPERRRGRERVVAALRADLADRGGLERATANWDLDADTRAELAAWRADDEHRRRSAAALAPRIEALLPRADGRLVAGAVRAGCHVFLTEDRGILGRGPRLFAWGIAALRPGELLDRLEAAGELDSGRADNGGLVPDLRSLAHFYALPASPIAPDVPGGAGPATPLDDIEQESREPARAERHGQAVCVPTVDEAAGRPQDHFDRAAGATSE